MKKEIFFLSLLLVTFFADAQNVGIGTSTPLARLHVTDSSVLFSATGDVPETAGLPPIQGVGRRMLWYSDKAAFRTGMVSGTSWDRDSIGYYSIAGGYNSRATGTNATAMGYSSIASGYTSIALGYTSIASGYASVALGISTANGFNSTALGASLANGQYSSALGFSIASGSFSSALGITEAKAYGALSVGIYNDITDNPGPNTQDPEDRIFQMGNGSSSIRSNVMTALRNGNVGIGTLKPSFKLDVANGSINTDSEYRIGAIPVLAVPGSGNLFVGKYAGRVNTLTGVYNTFSGDQAGYSNTVGYYNCFFGQSAGYANTDGHSNSFFGLSAGIFNTSGSWNTFIGRDAGRFNTTGNNNSFFGQWSGRANNGNDNAFFGGDAGFNNTDGSLNAFFGRSAGHFNITGSANTAIGYGATVTTDALTNTTAVGYLAQVNASNKIRLGNSSVTVIEGQVAYTFPSDGRFKTNITETVKGLDFILKLRPVIYNFQARKMDEFISGITSADAIFASRNYSEIEEMRQSGFIAQEVEMAAKETGYDFNGVVAPKNEKGTYSLAYSQFVVPLVKAVQEQQTMIEKQNSIIDQQNKKIEILMKDIILIKEKLK